MTREIDSGPFYLERLPDGKIEAPERFVEYEGQAVVRTRYLTEQKFTKPGWDHRRRGVYPYILGKSYCNGEEDREPMNPELEGDQLTVYYVEDGDRVLYEVIE